MVDKDSGWSGKKFPYNELTRVSNAFTENMCAPFEYLENKPASDFDV